MTTESATRGQWLRAAVIVVCIGLAIVLFWSLFAPWITLWISSEVFSYAVATIVDASGLSPLLVKGLIIILMIPFGWAVAEIVRFGLWDWIRGLFGAKQRAWHSKRLASALIVGYVAAYFLVLYGVSRESNFGHTTEGARKFYAVTPEGVRFYDSPGYDTKYGIKLQPMTTEIAVNLERAKRGQTAKRLVVASLDNIEFFDPLTGAARLWYYQHPGAEFELYTEAGFHPASGEALKPVTRDVVGAIRQSLGDAQRAAAQEQTRTQGESERAAAAERQRQHIARYVNPVGSTAPVVVITRSGHLDPDVTSRIATEIGGSSSLLRRSFVSDGLFDAAFDGDIGALRSLGLERHATMIVLGRLQSQMSASEVAGSMIHKCSSSLEVKVITPASGFAQRSFGVDVTGSGFSPEEAQRRCNDEVVARVSARVKAQ